MLGRWMRSLQMGDGAPRVRADQKARSLSTVGICFCLVSLVFFYGVLQARQRVIRLSQDPLVTATITKSWYRNGKGSGHFADLSFSRVQDGVTILCTATWIRIGPTSDLRRAGDYIQIAPRPGTCYDPDIPDYNNDKAHIQRDRFIGGCVFLPLGIGLMIFGYRRSKVIKAA